MTIKFEKLSLLHSMVSDENWTDSRKIKIWDILGEGFVRLKTILTLTKKKNICGKRKRNLNDQHQSLIMSPPLYFFGCSMEEVIIKFKKERYWKNWKYILKNCIFIHSLVS
jgi:hypothetical protein